MKLSYKFLFITLIICAGAKLFAQNNEVTIQERPLSKDATFKRDSLVLYDIDLKNSYSTLQEGNLSYIVKTPHGQLITQSTQYISLKPHSGKTIRLEIPSQKAGFYKVDFMINVTDYDDTVRRVFGVDVNNIVSTHPKPVDFNLFWHIAKAELARVPANFKVIEKPELSSNDYQVFLLEMKSLGNITIRGWLTLPKNRLPNEKLPVYMVLPGYGANLEPVPGTPHFACVALNVRGLGNSRDVIAPSRDDFITYNLRDKNKYIYRGVVMDCERMLDFVCSRKDFDSKSIYVTGGSMGAYLSLVLAGLDQRVTMVAADNPTFSDIRWTVGIDVFPMSSIVKYAKVKALRMDQVLKTLDYFDLKNFVPNIKCKVLVAIGLLDNYAPPFTEMATYNKITANKKLYIYPNLGHEVAPALGMIKGKWLYDNFKMFDRVMALKGNGNNATAEADNSITDNDNENVDKFDTKPVGMVAASGSKNSVYKAKTTAYYDVKLKNNLANTETGTLTCEVKSREGKPISVITRNIKLAPSLVKDIRLNLPLLPSGYYKAEIVLNVNDYSDTLHRSFGVDIGNIKSNVNEFETIGMVEHPGAKDAVFSGKNTIYYNVDLKNNFDNDQEGMLSCEITKDGKFMSLTSLAVKLPAKTVSQTRINLPTQKTGAYTATFKISVPNYTDSISRTFSVDTAGGRHTETHSNEEETVSITEHPGNKDATFKSSATMYYNIDLKNNYSTQQAGALSCQVTSAEGKVLSLTSVAVNLGPKALKTVRMNLPPQTSGFYKVNFIINTNDYDDTVRRVFGVDINNIRSGYKKPADFDSFWNTAKKELAAVQPHFRMVEHHELERGNDEIYLVEMQSLGNITVRGWLTLPKDRKKNEKVPVYVGLPGYGSEVKPAHDMTTIGFINLSVRGQYMSNDVIKPSREEYISYKIEDKNSYIFRGAIMDCYRLIDFIYSRPEFDNTAIFVGGGSMGGYLALALASLDKRVSIVAADNPTFEDYRSLEYRDDFPMRSLKNYADENSLTMAQIFNTLDYFDLKNFAPNIKCKTLVAMGLLDPIAPPNGTMVMYNNVVAPKKLFIYPTLAHEVDSSLGNFKTRWVFDNLGIF